MRYLAASIILLLLTACATPRTVPPACSAQFGDDASANATIAARCLEDADATSQARIAATEAIAQMTTNARIAATEAAHIEATATAVAETATAESVTIRITEQAMAMVSADATATRQAQATRDAISLTKEAKSLEVVALQQQKIQQELANQRRAARFWDAARYVLLGLGVVVSLVFVISAVIWWLRHKKPVQVIKDTNGRIQQIFIAGPNGDFRALAASQLLAPPEDEPIALLDAAPSPNWDAFVEHKDDLLVPIGVSAEDGTPIFIDRNREPHLLIPGSTGMGKTTSGLLPYATAMVGAGLHAIIFNGRGADFQALNNHPNVTIASPVARNERPYALQQFLNALVEEIDRRDNVLRQHNVHSWYQLPPALGEASELFVGIDEFLAIIEEAGIMADVTQDSKERKLLKSGVMQMWRSLIAITSEARKYGVYVAATVTDPTARAMGSKGMTVRDQMAKVCFGLKNADAARKILGGRSDNFPDGSAGLPPGQFVSNIMGRIQHGVAFHPEPIQIQQYLSRRNVLPTIIPDAILETLGGKQSQSVAPVIQMNGRMPTNRPMTQAEVDARKLDGIIEQCQSLNDVARILSIGALDRSVRPSGQEIDLRTKPALQWRVEHTRCARSLELLNRGMK